MKHQEGNVKKKTNIFQNCTLKNKILRDKPAHGGERLENSKTLIKETEDDSKKWKAIPCTWIGRILLKWPYYPKQLKDLMQSLRNYS